MYFITIESNSATHSCQKKKKKKDEYDRLVISISDVRFPVMCLLLEYLYTENLRGKLDSTTTLPGELLLAAEDFKVKKKRKEKLRGSNIISIF